jgi:hypothetical protein
MFRSVSSEIEEESWELKKNTIDKAVSVPVIEVPNVLSIRLGFGH